MENGYIENGFIVDVSNAHKTSEIIYELSTILDLPDAQSKKVCIKLGNIDLNTTELISIKALVESMNSEIEFITTGSQKTTQAATELGITISALENLVPTPEFNDAVEEKTKVNKELEKALDKIFGDENTKIQTFSTEKEIQKLKAFTDNNPNENIVQPEAPIASEPIENIEDLDKIEANIDKEKEILSKMKISQEEVSQKEAPQEELSKNALGFDDLNTLNNELENANNLNIDVFNDEQENLKEHLKETEVLPTLYIQRTLRSGQSLTSEGNVVIIGDVNPGSEIIAQGDITIWGVLGGIAHAGSTGNQYARIRALKMNAIQLRIADVFARRPDNVNIPYIQKTDSFVPEEACIRRKQIYIHKIHDAQNI